MPNIPITIYDYRSKKEFYTITDKLPVDKISKISIHCLKIILKNNIILINYHFQGTTGYNYSFRRFNYPEVELNETVVDDLIELIYIKLYEPNVLYVAGYNIEYPQDALLDLYEDNGKKYIKYKNIYNPVLEISFKEKDEIELSQEAKELLLSPEPNFECPEEYRHINWVDFLEFQPEKIIVEQFNDIIILCIIKSKLNIITYRFHKESEEIDTESNFHFINKIGNYKIIDNEQVIDEVEFFDCKILKTAKNIVINDKITFEKISN